MSDPSALLEILTTARGRVARDWGSTNLDVAGEAFGSMCASVSICATGAEDGCSKVVMDEAHRRILYAIGVEPAEDRDEMYQQVYAFNDAQESREPVLAAFDRAIADLASELTPKADATLGVMAACDTAAEVVAGYIVAEHPEMDAEETRTLAAAELFYAAQDTVRVCDLAARADA